MPAFLLLHGFTSERKLTQGKLRHSSPCKAFSFWNLWVPKHIQKYRTSNSSEAYLYTSLPHQCGNFPPEPMRFILGPFHTKADGPGKIRWAVAQFSKPAGSARLTQAPSWATLGTHTRSQTYEARQHMKCYNRRRVNREKRDVGWDWHWALEEMGARTVPAAERDARGGRGRAAFREGFLLKVTR